MKQGFTLVEIALAMFVFSLGVLAFFALLSTGLDQDQRAYADTRCAMFADGVFGGLRAVSDALTETATSNEWHTFWDRLRHGETNMYLPPGATNSMWVAPMMITGGSTFTNAYTNYAIHTAQETDIVNHIIRYRLHIELTNYLEAGAEPNHANVTLKVWEGAFGSHQDSDGLIFYTEYADRGSVR